MLFTRHTGVRPSLVLFTLIPCHMVTVSRAANNGGVKSLADGIASDLCSSAHDRRQPCHSQATRTVKCFPESPVWMFLPTHDGRSWSYMIVHNQLPETQELVDPDSKVSKAGQRGARFIVSPGTI